MRPDGAERRGRGQRCALRSTATRAGARATVHDGYKRTFDLCVLGIVAVLLAPLWLLLAIVIPVAIWLNDGRPIFFTQERVGLGDRDFRIIKFRSMQMPSSADRTPTTALAHVTAVGRLLRPLHLDELPQVVNILRGEMSLVGPRAEWRPRHDLICKQLPEFAQRLRVRPGIAGLAQARGHYWSSPREKLRYDNLYIDGLGPWLDIKLIFLCFYAVIRRASMSDHHHGYPAHMPQHTDEPDAEVDVLRPASVLPRQGHESA